MNQMRERRQRVQNHRWISTQRDEMHRAHPQNSRIDHAHARRFYISGRLIDYHQRRARRRASE